MSNTFLGSILNIALTTTVNLLNGFIIQPLTKIPTGSLWANASAAIPYINSSGQYNIGNNYSTSSILTQPTFTPVPPYQPGGTTPPITYPTTQSNGYVVPTGVNPANMYQFSAEALRVLKTFEGLQQRPYTINGVNYIGYGHMIQSNESLTYVSIDQANALLTTDLSNIISLIQGAITANITQGCFDCLTDFAYTTTSNKFTNSSVVSKVNSGDIAGAATDLSQWIYGTNNNVLVKIPHLASRRTTTIQWMTSPTVVLSPSQNV